MSPFKPQILTHRSGSSGTNFTVICGVIATLVIAICVLWGYLIPRWRKRHPARPSSTRFNGLGNASRYDAVASPINQTFPSHPALLRGFRKQPSHELRQYNPRTETPFPNSPPVGDSVSLPSIKLSRSPIPNPRDVNNSRGLFSPAKDSVHRQLGDLYSIPRTPEALTELVEHEKVVRRFGDTEDYILALPEPVFLQAKPAGCAPPLTRQLKQFPMPRSSSGKNMEKLPHPKKLFDELEQSKRGFDPVGNCTECPILTDIDESEHLLPISRIPLPKNDVENTKPTNLWQKSLMISEKAKAATCSWDAVGTDTLGKKKGYQDPFGNKCPKDLGIERHGTITRPKTPVSAICDFYDQNMAKNKPYLFSSASLKKNSTPSTEPLTISAYAESEPLASTTPPSSLIRPSCALQLLPDPLRPRRTYLQERAATPTPEQGKGRGRDVDFKIVVFPESPDKLAPLLKSLRSKRQERRNIGFYQRKSSRKVQLVHESTDSDTAVLSPKHRPANLNLSAFSVTPPLRQNKGDSMSSVASLLSPPTAKKGDQRSYQGSSIYSRETRELSFINTPVSPYSPVTVTAIADKYELLEQRKAKSIDLLRSKIDEWDLHTDDFKFLPSTTPLKRTVSDLGPRSPGLPTISGNLVAPRVRDNVGEVNGLGFSIPKICIGRSSDDIFGEDDEWKHGGARVLKRVLDMELASPTTDAIPGLRESPPGVLNSNMTKGLGRTAPGGAEWI